jgi:LAO/AO transport system kinase
MSTDLAKGILKGDHRAAAKLMSLIENDDRTATAVLKAIYPRTGNAHVIGVTGAAGTGKSSLIDRMTAEFRRRKKSVGILAVDPSSRFSSGALLGDRVRMRDHFLDDGVFIRSFATRGRIGGISSAICDAIHVLDALGKEIIIVETIGVGQDELEVAALVHTVVVVLIPEMGDEVQAMKAGLMEIADIVVVNKSDLPGADLTARQLKALFREAGFAIVPTSALNNNGVPSLVDRVEEHQLESLDNGNFHNVLLKSCKRELLFLLRQRFAAKVQSQIGGAWFDQQVKRIAERRIDPYSAADKVAKRLGL